MDSNACFVEVNNNVVTLKIVNEGNLVERHFNSQDLQKLGVHKVLLKEFQRLSKPKENVIDPYDNILSRDF